MDELANTEGYVAEKRLAKTSESLLVDPSQLSREERALQRAIMKFSEMEFLRKNKASQDVRKSQSTTKSSSRRKAGELKKKAINRHKAGSTSHKHKFEDFKPIVLRARTRLQALSPELSKRPTIPNQRRTSSGQRHRRRHAYSRRRKSLSSGGVKSKRRPVRVAPSGEERRNGGGGGASGRAAPSPRRRRKQRSWSGCFLFSDRGRKCRRAKYGKATSGPRLPPSEQSPTAGGRSFTVPDQIRARLALFESPRVEINRLSAELASGSVSSSLKNLCTPTSSESQSVSGHVDDDAMSTCSNSQGDFNRHNIPPEVRRLNVCKETGETILHKAARMGYVDIVLWCCRTQYVDVNARDYAGFSALHETCISESVETARCLLEHGADVNVASRLDGVRPLHDAIERDHFGLVRLFLSWGADPTLSTYSGRTALKIARTRQMRDFLMAYFVDLNGAFHMDKESTWEIPFDSQAGVTMSEYPYSDIFAGLPEDADPEESREIVFDMSDNGFIPCYCLALEKGTRPHNYVLLADLLTKLGTNEVDFRKRHRGITIEKRCLSELDGPDVYQIRRLYRPYSHVALIRYDEKVKVLLDVETVKFGRFDDDISPSGDVVQRGASHRIGGHVIGRGPCNDKRQKQARSKVNSAGARTSPPTNGRAALKSPSWTCSRRNGGSVLTAGNGESERGGVRSAGSVGRRSRPEMMISLISGKTVLSPGVMTPVRRHYDDDVTRSVRGSESVAAPIFVITPEITVTRPDQNEALICLLPDASCQSGSGGLTAVAGVTAVSDLTGDQCVADPEGGCGLKITKVCSLSESAAKRAFGPDL